MKGASTTIPRLTVEDWTLLQARLMWCYEGGVEVKYHRRRAERRYLSAWCVLAGEAKVRMGRKSWRAGPGEWLLAGPDSFEQEFSEEARILSVNFRLEWPSGDSLVGQPLVVSAAEHPDMLKAGRTLGRFQAREFPGARTELWKEAAGLEEFFELQHVFSAWVLAYLCVGPGFLDTRKRLIRRLKG